MVNGEKQGNMGVAFPAEGQKSLSFEAGLTCVSGAIQGIRMLVAGGMNVLTKQCFLLRSTGNHHALVEMALKLPGISVQI